MKKIKLHPIFLWIIIPTLALVALLMFFSRPALETYDMIRPEDAGLSIKTFELTVMDHALYASKYTVRVSSDTCLDVSRTAQEDDFELIERAMPDGNDSALTADRIPTLLKPVWEAMQQALRGGDRMEARLITPGAVNDSLSRQRKTHMTLSVSTGAITEVTGTYLGETEYGMIHARIMEQKSQASAERYIMLIP